MVDAQTISIIFAGVSIGIAASYYAMNLREIRRSRRISLSTTVLEPFMTVEGNKLFMELQAMTWDDLDDYLRKYDHKVNPENSAKRLALWNRCHTIGSLYREGLLDLKTLYVGSGGQINRLWIKFRPIIEMYRGSDYDQRAYEDWEYLAEKLDEYLDSRGIVGLRGDELRESPGTTI
jgi:hypothetical protein